MPTQNCLPSASRPSAAPLPASALQRYYWGTITVEVGP